MIANFVYDVSFLKYRKLVIDGDVESNPGPVSTFESYRASIGRYNCKFKLRENWTSCNGKDVTFSLLKMMIFLLFNALFVGLIIMLGTDNDL